MLKKIIIPILFLFAVSASICVAEEPKMEQQAPSSPEVSASYPKIVLYSVSWCPRCREAKAYLAQKHIPYVNKDVEADEAAMDTLLNRYKTTRVPLIVIGNDEAVLQGFIPENFEKALAGVKNP